MTSTLHALYPGRVQTAVDGTDTGEADPICTAAASIAFIGSLKEAELAQVILDEPGRLLVGPCYRGGFAPAELVEASIYDPEPAFADWKMGQVRQAYDQTTVD